MKNLIVQKYGGACVARVDQILHVAQGIAQKHQQGHSIIVVVSAMGNSTDQLIRKAFETSPSPQRRELDMLLSTGERVTMSLLSMALHDLKCPAISFTGSQAGILTDEAHNNARILKLTPFRVAKALEEHKVVVLAGYQGVNPQSKEITTLGRGGSDTTAVAMASHFKARRCEIYKDVPGVHSCDPKLVPKAQPHASLSYDQLLDMCFWGSPVLHFRSIELAQKLQMPLYISAAQAPEKGTLVTTLPSKDPAMFTGTNELLSLNSHTTVLCNTVESSSLEDGFKLWNQFLLERKLESPQILFSNHQDGRMEIFLTGPREGLKSLSFEASSFPKIQWEDQVFSSITATCSLCMDSKIFEKSLSILQEKGIPLKKVAFSPLSFSLFVPQEHREETLTALHQQLLGS